MDIGSTERGSIVARIVGGASASWAKRWSLLWLLLVAALHRGAFGKVQDEQREPWSQTLAALPVEPETWADSDWLIDPTSFEAGVFRSADGSELVLSNGMVRRAFRLEPNFACVGLDRGRTALLRAVRPEARVQIDGQWHDVGGLVGQPNHAYLDPAWLEDMGRDPDAWAMRSFTIGEPHERMQWARVRHHAPDVRWPPAGVALHVEFVAPIRQESGTVEDEQEPQEDSTVVREDRAQESEQEHESGLEATAGAPEEPASEQEPTETAGGEDRPPLRVVVHYELYDGIPLFCKWISVHNDGEEAITVDRFHAEVLAAVESVSRVESRGVPMPTPDLHVETDYAFGGMSAANANRWTVHWREDPQYSTQVNYLRTTPCLLEVGPQLGPSQDIGPGEEFRSFHVFELAPDSTDRTRRGLAQRRMMRTVAPWVTENPLMMHVRSADPDAVRLAIDQCADVGFEMVILTFGSGFDIEDESDENIARWKELAAYAQSRGVELGGYSLLASRRIQPDSDNCLNPETGEPGGQTFGYAPALASQWGQEYFRKLRAFYEATDFRLLEHDGSYPGDADAAARPPLQRGYDDSRWVQWRIITDFYRFCRARGVYLNVPDYYYLSGSNKCGMGYRETNWSLPREQQRIHTRQNLFDGTLEKTPSMGWMFVPLTQYHGGGAAATVEPLAEHLDHYESLLASNLGYGAQACYRGPRLYDEDETRERVRAMVQWFLEYRDILEADVVHSSSRRADGRGLDWVLHAHPGLVQKGMLVVFNPMPQPQQQTLTLDLYYTGLVDLVRVRDRGGRPESRNIERDGTLQLEVEVPAGGWTWFLFE